VWKVANAHTKALKESQVRSFRLYDLRHTWATRAAEAGMDMPTLAALLGLSKLNMVMRYAHPQEQHQTEAMRKLETFNVAKEIAEVEKARQKQSQPESVPTISPTVTENPAHFLVKESEGKPNQINEEAPIGFEPMHKGFADLSLTTWVRRQAFQTLKSPGNGLPGL